MRLLRFPRFAPALLATVLMMATRARAADDGPEWTFSLLPNAFSKNPRLSMTVFTEFTPAGREIEPPTVQDPDYYVLHDAGRLKLGSSAPAGEKAPAPELLEKQMRAALASNGFVVTDNPGERRPALAVLMHWGSYTTLGDTEEADLAVSPGGEVDSRMATPAELTPQGPRSEMTRRRELFERAALVGGERFALELAEAIVQRDKIALATPQPRSNPAESVSGGALPPPVQRVGGDVQSMSGFDMMDPLYLFENRDAKTRRLMSQARGSFYFVIASAFDYGSLATSKRRLLWRTKMTVASSGVSMVQTLPVLIANSAPYIGREMTAPETTIRRVRDGKVKIEPIEVIGYEEDEAEAANEAKSAAPPAVPDKPSESTPRRP